MLIKVIKWAAWLGGTAVLIVLLIAVTQIIGGVRNFEIDYQIIALYAGLLIGLPIAYKRPLLGGSIATLGILISRFFHPLVMIPGILYIIYGLLLRRRSGSE